MQNYAKWYDRAQHFKVWEAHLYNNIPPSPMGPLSMLFAADFCSSDTQSKLGIPREEVERIETIKELLWCMERYNYLSSTNTWLLQYLMYRVGNRPLYKKVFEFTGRRLKPSQALFVCEPNEIQGKLLFVIVIRKINSETW